MCCLMSYSFGNSSSYDDKADLPIQIPPSPPASTLNLLLRMSI